ncbi:hypothetical protein, partial [Pseudonocardia adelaidensis]|uniref:hypothetical protein n=1 Tax=Pseudonocardia adelaidensis TaxID=648754 RepID=UPI0031ED375A
HVEVPTGTARIEDGPEIPATTAERLACDARVQALLDDRRGNRMYFGRTRRLASPAQIAAPTPDWDGNRLDPEPILDVLLPRRITAAA